MKKIIIKRIYPECSSMYVCENHKQLLPAIEFFSNTIGTMHGWQFKFWWWKYWIKIYVTFLYQ